MNTTDLDSTPASSPRLAEETASPPPVPAGESIVSRSLYNCGYYLGYGIMFPTTLVVRSLPLDNVIGHGLADGAHAATEAAERAHAGIVHAAEGAVEKSHAAYAAVARTVQEKVESVQDAMAERRFRKSGTVEG